MRASGHFKALAAMAAALFLFSAGAFAQDLPQIAVYVTGDVPDNEKKALGTRMLASLVNSGRYIGIERSNAFLAEIEKEQLKQRSGAIDDGQISELGRQFGVRFVCIADITPAFGEFQVSARIVDVETAVVVFIGESASPLKSMTDLARVSDRVVRNMFGEEAKSAAKAKAEPEPAAPKPEPEPRPKSEPRPKPEFKISAGGGALLVSGVGGGLTWGNSKENLAMPYTAGGAYIFLDAVYAEAFIGFLAGGGKWQSGDATYQNDLPDMPRAGVNIGAFAKYPIAAGTVKAFPLLGFEYEASVSGKLVYASGKEETFDGADGRPDAGALSALWFRFGCGADFDLSQNLYLRAEFLYGLRNANAYENDRANEEAGFGGNTRPGHGLTLKIGAGVKF